MFVAHEAEKTFQVAYDRAKLNNAAATRLLSRLQERARPVDRLRTKTPVARIGVWKFVDAKSGTYTFFRVLQSQRLAFKPCKAEQAL